MGALACTVILLLPAVSGAAAHSIVTDTATIVGADSPGPYWLSGFFIVGDSVQVLASTFAPAEYDLDPNNGRITFGCTLSSSDTVTIVFQRLGFALRSRLSVAPTVASEASSGMIPVTYAASVSTQPTPIRAMPAPSQLQWQGHKSFSVTASDAVGSDWSQGMELNVSGEITPGLRLSAAVSDRRVGGVGSSPRDGSRLGDLERFYIEVMSDRFRGRWGELRLEREGTDRRRVSGFQMGLDGANHTLSGYVARPHGETQRTQVRVVDGVFGPYPIAATGAHVQIVDGSQSVWLDGRPLAEGRHADYTMDAARGTISLSPRLALSERSILIVEFESALDDYRRSMTGGAWSWRSDDSSLSHSLSAGWEGDDPNNPLFGALTEQQRALLAGSQSGQVMLRAAEHVGEHDGDYHIEVSSENDSIFVYAGPDQGEWTVKFQWVGELRGQYRHVIDDVFEYAGEGKGNYEPVLTLSAPDAEATLEEQLRLVNTAAGDFALDWQGVAVDRNRFSSGSSVAHANHVVGWAAGSSDKSRGPRASIDWHHQAFRPRSRPLGVGVSQFTMDWRLRSELLADEFDHIRAAAEAPVGKAVTASVQAGQFSHRSVDGWRSDLAITVAPTEWMSIKQQVVAREILNRNSGSSRTLFNAAVGRAQVREYDIEAIWQSEDIDDPTHVFTFASDANAAQRISISRGGFIIRQEWRRSHDWESNHVRRTVESSVGLPAARLGASAGSGLTAVHGRRTLGDGATLQYHAGRLGGVWSRAANFSVSADVDLSHRQAGAQRETFIPTRPGQGDYRFERGEYVPDPHGDYRRVLVDDELGEMSAYDALKQVRLNWKPLWFGWRWSVDLTRRIDARYSSEEFSIADWILPWTELASSVMDGAQLSTRDDHRLTCQLRSSSRASMSVAQERQFRQSTGAAGPVNQRAWRVESDWREDVSTATYVQLAGQLHRRTRDGSASPTIDSDARAVLVTLGHSPLAGLGLAVEGRRRIDREFGDRQTLGLWGIRPSARISRGGLSGSFTSDFTWLRGNSQYLHSPLLAEGRPRGFSWTESVEVRWQFPARISLNARLSGDHRPDEPDRWRMHLETVATF